ncbi:MAG: leucine-rich repeat protein [Clostridia bacterium]|nr:leucine-rich repeat protein [Clostridia bacterium]
MKKSMKKVVSLLIALVMLAVSVPVALIQVQAFGSITYELNPDGESYCVAQCDDNYFGRAKISAKYDGKPVTRIAANAFDYSDIYAVVIPDTVTVIEDSAFLGCDRLKTVTFGNSVTEIQAYAFGNCTRMNEITIPESMAVIGDYAFIGCSSLKKIYFLGTTTDVSMYSEIAAAPGAIVYGYIGSTAEHYAMGNNFAFESILCEAVELIEPVLTNEGVYFSWAKIKNATSYKICRKTEADVEWTEIASVKRTEFTDKTVVSGEKYIYTIKANNGKVDGEFNAAGVDTMYLSAPVLESVVSGKKGVTVKWAAVEGAEEYWVYHKTGESNWKKIGVANGTSFLDRKAEIGKDYTYTVVASAIAYRKTIKSGFDEAGLTTTVNYTATPVIESLDVTKYNQVTLKWSVNDGADYYLVYRSDKADGKFKGVAKVKTNTWTDTDIKFNNKYFYKVITVVDGVQSAASPVRGRTSRVPSPVIDKRIFVKPGQIELKWNKVSGASGYAVFRCDDANGKWVRIATLKGKENVKFVDKTTGDKLYKVYAYKTVNKKNYYGVESEVVSTKTFNKQQLEVKQLNSAFVNEVSWTPAKGATGYLVYYKVGPKGTWTKAAALSSRFTSYTMDVMHGEYYYWKVRPIYESDGYTTGGEFSDTRSFMIYYTPNIRVAIGKDKIEDAKTVTLTVENKGVCNFRVLKDGGYIYNGADKIDNNGPITLVDSTLKAIDYVDVAPGKTETVTFSITGPKQGYYDDKTIVQFYFMYDNMTYILQTDANLENSNARYQLV